MNAGLPLFLPGTLKIRRVVVEPAEWERSAALRGQRALLLVKHPSEVEPAVVAWLARRETLARCTAALEAQLRALLAADPVPPLE